MSRKIPNQEDVADLCQEVLLHAYLQLNSFQGRSGFCTLLLSIAKHAIAEYYRSSRGAAIIDRYQATRRSSVPDEALRSYESIEESCDIRRKIEDWLACIIKTLSLEEQLAVILCDFYGFTDNESSKIMAKSLGAFKHLLHRTRGIMELSCQHNCALVRRTGAVFQEGSRDVPACHLPVVLVTYCDASSETDGQPLSYNALLSLRAELLREIGSLIHSDPSRSSGRWPLHVSAKPIFKTIQRHPRPESP